jgi:ferritin-like metal-binding protein YciE
MTEKKFNDLFLTTLKDVYYAEKAHSARPAKNGERRPSLETAPNQETNSVA